MLIVLPGEKVPDRADEGFANAELSLPHPPSATVPLSHRRGLSSLELDSATSPIGFAQNDKGGFSIDRDYCLLKVKYSW